MTNRQLFRILLNAGIKKEKIKYANLRDANLRGADLRGADLQDANLRDADLRGADLRDAYLRDANLRDADLRDADLRDADLLGADLRGVKLNYNSIGVLLSCPEIGEFIAWKKVNGNIIKMKVPESAKRSSSTTRKCRFEFVEVLSITNDSGNQVEKVINNNYVETIYEVGKITYPDSYDENRWNECSNGIHGFITKIEAENWY